MAMELYVSPKYRDTNTVASIRVEDLERLLSRIIHHWSDHPDEDATIRVMPSAEGRLTASYHCSLWEPLNIPEGFYDQ